jgi:hypothetical protein
LAHKKNLGIIHKINFQKIIYIFIIIVIE